VSWNWKLFVVTGIGVFLGELFAELVKSWWDRRSK
jgi:hypothetical protein